jgi:signal transduction histidine kinase
MPDRLKVLVVDDDSQMLRTIGDILRFKGYDPVPAGSGAAGIAAAESRDMPPAIALIDLRLPDMDGIELVGKLRELAPMVEVLILTGHASVDSAVRALREQSYDYLLKPVSPDQLLSSMSRASDRWQRRMAEAALEDSELRLRSMFECVSDAVFITDDDRRIIDANPAALTLSARDLETLKGASLDALLEPSRRRLDVRSSAFAPGLHVHSVRDMSEQLRLEAALHHSQKMDAIGRLAGGIAHDFNNLLTVVNGFASLLLSRHATEDPDRELISEIVGAAQRGAALTRQLLTFSRKQSLNPRVVDVNTTVRGLETIIARLVGDEVPVAFKLDDAADPVFADPGQLEQVLINLVVNARDAMPAGGRLTITSANVREAAESGTRRPYVRLTVTDTGIGMSADVMQRIFEPFFTTKPEGKGTGLGLATVHGIVEQSGGFVRVDSTPGHGTSFAIHLPSHEGPALRAATAAPPPVATA